MLCLHILFPLGKQKLWAGGKMSLFCFALWICSALPNRRQNLQSCAFVADVTIPSFYQKHLELLNSFCVHVLKHSHQSFHI